MTELKKPDLTKPVFKMFPQFRDRVANNRCPYCNKEITTFRNEKSEKEYSISGLCQECQDKVFGKGED